MSGVILHPPHPVTIRSKLGSNLQLRYGDIVVNKTTQAGDVLKFNSKQEDN